MDGSNLWLCSDCQRIRDEIQQVLSRAPSKGPDKHLAADFIDCLLGIRRRLD